MSEPFVEDATFRVDEGRLQLVLKGDFTKLSEVLNIIRMVKGELVFDMGAVEADKLCESWYEIKHG